MSLKMSGRFQLQVFTMMHLSVHAHVSHIIQIGLEVAFLRNSLTFYIGKIKLKFIISKNKSAEVFRIIFILFSFHIFMHDYFFDSSRLYGKLGEREMIASQRGIIKLLLRLKRLFVSAFIFGRLLFKLISLLNF